MSYGWASMMMIFSFLLVFWVSPIIW
ncbi:unnamed protein product [Spirodela intermedia]|uniref:Uncharacterized protein n=1 Tax=Spirodela intermedia TaxID=51605 RepID=A0A7I8K3U3_SPIIN|nr:unnamed protein product [Spirodela intermedia]